MPSITPAVETMVCFFRESKCVLTMENSSLEGIIMVSEKYGYFQKPFYQLSQHIPNS